MDGGELIATRLLTPGVNIPFEIEMLEPVCALLLQRMAHGRCCKRRWSYSPPKLSSDDITDSSIISAPMANSSNQ
jgi:hypothetical protein